MHFTDVKTWGSEGISTCVRSQSIGMNQHLSDFQAYALSY